MKNKKTKIILISVVIFLVIASVTFFLYFKNHKPNILKGSVSEIPVNSSFTDISLYSCVVDSYNKENNTNYNRNVNLTDEQLSSIKNLDCMYRNPKYQYSGGYLKGDSENLFDNYEFESNNTLNVSMMYKVLSENYEIENINGIDKLSGVQSIDLYIKRADNDPNMDSFDFSKNKELTSLSIASNYAETNSVNLTGLTKLKKISVDNFQMTSFIGIDTLTSLEDFSTDWALIRDYSFLNSLTSLKKLSVEDYDFQNLSVISNLTNLEELSIVANSSQLSSDSISLGELSYLTNLKKLVYRNNINKFGTLPEMDKLETLIIGNNVKTDQIDFSNFPNLTTLDIKDSSSNVNKLSDLTGITSLTKLNYLTLNYNINNLSGIESLTNLESLYVSSSNIEVPTMSTSVKKIYGGFNSYVNFPNVTNIYGIDSDKLTPELALKLKYLTLNDLSSTFLSNLNNYNFSNLEFYNGNLTPELLAKFINIKGITFSSNSNSSFDFSNNSKLESVIINSYSGTVPLLNLNKLTKLKQFMGFNTVLDSYDFSNSPLLETFYSNNSSTDSSDLTANFSNSPNLEFLTISDSAVSDINVKNNINLEGLVLTKTSIPYLDIRNCNKLKFTQFENNSFQSPEPLYSLVGLENDLPGVALPSQYKLNNNEIPEEYMTLNNNKLIVNYPVADSAEFSFLNTLPLTSSMIDLTIDIQPSLVVSKILFSKYDYNFNKNYLFTGNDVSEKSIISNIKQKGMYPVSAIVDRKKLKLIIANKVVKSFDLIGLTSSSYDIKDNNIEYNGDFNIDNVKISNATGEVVDNKLKIKYGEDIIKEYTLVKKNNLLGDVNNDGEITISDIVIQYKHIKYVTDLEGDALYRADINKDDDVSISDVPSLYKYIKGQTDSVGSDK